MKSASSAMQAWLALRNESSINPAKAWLCKRQDGQVFAFTNKDRDFAFNLEAALVARGYVGTYPGITGTGARTYLSSGSYETTDVDSSGALNVDNSEIWLLHPAITDDDLRAGKWDDAKFVEFIVNYSDLTMGAVIMRTGIIGNVTIDNGIARAELRGLMRYLTDTINRPVSPACDADLGDARCGVDLAGGGSPPWTVTGAVDGVSADGMHIFDAARIEPGPTGGIAIVGMTNANPGVVTLAADVPWEEGQLVTLSTIAPPTPLNTIVMVHNPSGATFGVGFDTSDTSAFPAYASGGIAVALGEELGFFDEGKITFNTGLNAGISREVKSYVEGQISLALPFPYAIVAGDTYTMSRGCNKAFNTCRDVFDNVVNFRGFNRLPGRDFIVQVGRHT